MRGDREGEAGEGTGIWPSLACTPFNDTELPRVLVAGAVREGDRLLFFQERVKRVSSFPVDIDLVLGDASRISGRQTGGRGCDMASGCHWQASG